MSVKHWKAKAKRPKADDNDPTHRVFDTSLTEADDPMSLYTPPPEEKEAPGRQRQAATLKHSPGGADHNQARHGWRYGSLAAARRSMRGQTDVEERGEYRKRAGISTEPTTRTAINKKLRAIEDGWDNKKHEEVVFIDPSGKTVFTKGGDESSISFSEKEWEDISGKDLIATHNHPLGWQSEKGSPGRDGNSFSTEDIYTAVETNLKEFRAVTPNYTFIMRRPERGWSFGMLRELKAIERDIVKDVVRMVSEGIMTVDQARSSHYHLLSEALSSRYGYEYRREYRGH